MFRSPRIVLIPHVLFLAIVLLLVPAAFAEDNSEDLEQKREALALEIEGNFLKILASEDIEPTYEEHGNGLYSLSFPLPEDLEKSLDLEEKAANFLPLAAGMQLSEPSSTRTLIHAAFSRKNFDYNYWWAAANLTNTNRTRNTRLQKAGPGRKFNRNFNVTYRARTVHVFWYNPGWGVGRAGVQTLKARITGGGQVVARSYAE